MNSELNKQLVEELIETSKGIKLEPYQKGGDELRQIYYIKRVQVKGEEGFCLAYNRNYIYIGTIPLKEFERLLRECNIINIWLNYAGGFHEPKLKFEDISLINGAIYGDAFWIAPKESNK